MSLWFAASLILIVLSLYMLVTMIYQVAFRLTGLSQERVNFQVASMFTGAGFTTQESELIAANSARRKLAIACMYTGHIFTALVIGLVMNLFFNLTNQESTQVGMTFFYVSLGVFLFFVFLKIPPVNKRVQKLLGAMAEKLMERHNKKNVLTPLDVYDKKAVVEITLNQVPAILLDRPLKDVKLTKVYEINVLMIRRKGRTLNVTPNTILQKGDLISVFGTYQNIKDLFGHVEKKEEDVDQVLQKTQNEITLVDNYGENAMCDIVLNHVPIFLKGKEMRYTGLRDRFSINIVMLRRGGEALTVEKDTVLEANDEIVLFGKYASIKELFMGE